MIEKSILLRCPPDEASQLLESTGRFWERSRGGFQIELGRVLAWEPPRPTASELTFTSEDGGTRVTVHHHSKPESGDL